MQWIKSRNCDIIDDKEDGSPSTLSQSLDIRQNGPRKIRVKHGAAILEDLLGPPIWRLLKCNRLELTLAISSRLISWTDPETFTQALLLALKLLNGYKLRNMCIFFDKRDLSFNAPVNSSSAHAPRKFKPRYKWLLYVIKVQTTKTTTVDK